MKSRPTLRDVAKATGYHFTTVGLALRGDPRILPETAKKIQAVARNAGYVQDAMLSALSSYRHAKRGRFAGVIGFLHTYVLPREHKTNHRARVSFEAAAARARELGFKLEPFCIREPGLTGKRLTEVLRARGIKGLILAPLLPLPGPFLELDWSQFVTVAMGYSVTAPEPHRAAFNQADSLRIALRELRRLGYRKIGLQLLHEQNIRTRANTLGAYLADQLQRPPAERIPPFFTDAIRPAELRAWIKKHRPDCILCASPNFLKYLEDMGYSIPEDFGLAVISRDGDTCKVAGIDEQSDLLGVSAVDFTVSLLQINDRGLPAYPRFMLVEGRWVWTPTLHPPASAEPTG